MKFFANICIFAAENVWSDSCVATMVNHDESI